MASARIVGTVLIAAAAWPLFASAQEKSRSDVKNLAGRLSCVDERYSSFLRAEEANWPSVAQRRPPIAATGSAEIALRRVEIGEDWRIHEVLQLAEKAVRAAPEAPESHLVLAKAATLAGFPHRALTALERAAALGADEQALKVVQAKFALSAGRLEIAERLLEEAAVAPVAGYARSVVQMMLGNVRADLGKMPEAELAYRDAAETACSFLPYIKYANVLFYVKGDLQSARRVLRTSMQRFPSDRQARRLLGSVDYFVWAQALADGKATPGEGARLAQTSFASPEEVFIEASRYPGGLVIMRALVESGILRNVDVRDGSGNTALIAAAKANNSTAGQYLLRKGAKADSQNGFGERALTHYARHGNLPAIDALLDRGAEVDFVDRNGTHPIAAAVSSGRAEALGLLLKAKSSYQRLDAHDLVSKAVLRGDIAVLETLLKRGAPANGGDQNPPPLMLAVMMRDIEVVRCLLRYGADPLREFDGASIQELARQTLDPAIISELSRSKL